MIFCKRFLLATSFVAVLAGEAWAQTGQPNCVFNYRFTNRTGEDAQTGVIITGGAGAAPWIDNTALGCVGWQLQYSSEGFSAISINLQSAPRVYAGVTGASTQGAASTFSGTDVLSSLPLTSTTGGNYIGYAFYPYIRVNLATATGTGTVQVTLNGWKSITYAKGIGAGGGSITTGTPNQIAKYTGTTTIGDSIVTDDGTTVSVAGRLNIKTNPFIIELPNSSTGTTTNKLAKAVVTGGVLQAQILTTSAADQASALGCVIAGGGTSGTALIMVAGTGSCYFDAATTAGHIAVPSGTSAGALHDTGSASSPTSGEVMATVGATNACGSPPCLIAGNLFMTPDLVATGGNGNGGGNGGGNGAKQQSHSYTCTMGSATGTTAIVTGDTGCYADNGVYSGTINRVDTIGFAASLATCSITVDIWKRNAAVPTASQKISASAPATLSSANISTSGSLSGWTTSVADGDQWGSTVASVTGCVYAQVKVFYQ